MTKREQNRLIRNRIEAGASAQQVYDELHGNSLVPDERLAERVREVPTLERRRRYKTGHVALMVLLGLAAALRLIIGMARNVREVDWLAMALFVAVCLACVVGLALHRGKAYFWSAFVIFLSTMGNRTAGWAGPEWAIGSLWITMVAIVVLGLYLHGHMQSRYIIIKEPYKNEAGEARLKNVVRFED
jgi:hypothetical protein